MSCPGFFVFNNPLFPQFIKNTKHSLLRMIGQSRISTFFLPLGQKRPGDMKQNPNPEKKQKTETSTPSSPDTQALKAKSESPAKTPISPGRENIAPQISTSTLSPEQTQKIAENRLAAKSKLLTKQTHGLVMNAGHSWVKALEPEFNKPYFLQLSKFVESERKSATIYPPADEVFSWTQLCNIRDVKVVILGQDPYHGTKQAHGLCFSVKKGIATPPSLLNMYKELENDIEGFERPEHGNLTGWAEQGVLMLNAVLTVRASKANSHKDRGWEKFTDAVVSWLNKNTSGLVFMLWGAYAQKKGACIDTKKHHILKSVHPSPLSAHRGFFGCKHFSQANDLLKKQGLTPIDWERLPQC